MTATTGADGVTTVDELVVTAKPLPAQDTQPPGLQQASWRGLPFGVLSADSHFGRRQAVHEYPFRDDPYLEDIGRATRRIQILGFLVTDSLVYGGGDVIAQREAFVAAAETSGPGTLVHPTLGSLQVSLESLVVNERLDASRYFELQLSFFEAGERQFPSAASATGDAVASAASGMDAAASGDFSAAITPLLASGGAAIQSVVGEAASWATNAVRLGADASGLFNLAAQLTGPFGRFFNGANQGFGAIIPTVLAASTTIDDLVGLGAASRAALALATGAETTIAGQLGLPGALPPDMAGAAQAATAALAATTANPADAIRVLSGQAAYATGTSSAIAGAVGDLHRRAAVTALARAASLYQPASQDDAANVRATVTAALDTEITVAGDEEADASFVALRALRTAVVIDLNARGAALAAMVVFTESAPLPSLVIANQLYRDASRFTQLETEASPIHPLFMPLAFQALAA